MKRSCLCLLLSALLLTGCTANQSAPGQGGDHNPMPYQVELQTVEETSCAPKDNRLLARCHYEYPRILPQEAAAAESFRDKAEIATPAEIAAERVNQYFVKWLEDRMENFREISEVARRDYEAQRNMENSSWDNEDYYYTDTVRLTSWHNYKLACLSLWSDSFTGGAHSVSVRTTVTFDMATGKPVTISDMVKDYAGLRDKVVSYISREIGEIIASDEGGPGFFTDYADVLTQWINRTVAFEEDGIVVIFGVYDIAPYAAGEQEFHIPYEVIRPYLNQYGLESLNLSK